MLCSQTSPRFSLSHDSTPAQSHFDWQHVTVSASGPERYCAAVVRRHGIGFGSQIKDVTLCPHPNWCHAKIEQFELPLIAVGTSQQQRDRYVSKGGVVVVHG